ncbi:ImmA/IrrE family metallo-endopeptidase [Candidatus Magnetaquicoccus inordinatus]|uniref:ImmA/IrrE family metallo-endopeptidase n=1 Tax=Candidatus Magnetaquicoccus inordinatus TaxID=2496818 RepID=UPI00102C3257|nr:ImmA/IrrE family metallo-endopeptidase [Candidatus Magnetaquicoccus inordinatus]
MPSGSGVPESKLTYAAIESEAEKFASEHGFSSHQNDIRDLVAKLGGTLDVAPFSDPLSQHSGSMRAWRDGRFIIYLSPFTGVLRDNFTIAHELGHFKLHIPEYFKQHPEESTVTVYRFGEDKPEWQANRFAAALLMPRTEFFQLAEKTGWKEHDLSVHFGVSKPAAKFRAESLKREYHGSTR